MSETMTKAEMARTRPGSWTPRFTAGMLAQLRNTGDPLWSRVRDIEQLDPETMADVIFECARTKIDVVASDERDSGRRMVLNLGHTVGHAIEAATRYSRYRHAMLKIGVKLLACVHAPLRAA